MHLGLEPSDVGRGVVRRITLSADGVRGVFECGHPEQSMSKNEWHICGNVRTHGRCRCCQASFWVNSMYKTKQMLKERT